MGASGAMSNGTIIARAGSASVAMVADAMQRPVIICCETLKFVDRVQLDSITYNELGSPDSLAIVDGHPELTDLQGWQDQPQLGEAHFFPGRQNANTAAGEEAIIWEINARLSQNARTGAWYRLLHGDCQALS